MKKILAFILILFLLSKYVFVFSQITLVDNNLYFLDKNNNGKIDTLELEFNKPLNGTLNTSKIFLYSNTGGLSDDRLDSVFGENIFSSYSLSGNLLILNLVEQNKSQTGLIVNNGVTSHLRLKTNIGVGIFDEDGVEIKLGYTSSFNSYKNVYFKETKINNTTENIGTGVINNSGSLVNTGTLTDTGSISNSGNIIENTGSLTNTGEVINSGTLNNTGTENQVIKSFSGKNIFQNPTYLTDKEKDLEIYNCLTTQTDCRVNYNLNISFGSGFETISTTKYNCEWDFGLNEFVEEKYKCNPNTITYPEGTFNTTYKISEISNPNNYFTKTIKIINTGYKEPENIKTVYVGGGSSTSIVQYMYIETPKINIQSGLDENNNCKIDECNLNLSYTPKNSREVCLWYFPLGTFETGTDKKCNPGYIKYPFGEHKVTLKVYEAGNENNFKETQIFFKNPKEKNILQQNTQKLEEKTNTGNTNNSNSQTGIISSQSGSLDKNYFSSLKILKVLPNPSLKEDEEFIELINNGTGEINLSNCELDDKIGVGSKPFLIQTGSLEAGKTKKFYRKNTHISLNNSGEEVNLICDKKLIHNLTWKYKTTSDFIVDENNQNLEKSDLKKEKLIQKLEIKELFKDQKLDYDDIKIINDNFSQKIKKQKSGIKIYGKTFPNTKVIIELKKLQNETSFFILKTFADNNYFQTISDENGDYELKIDKVNIGEFEVKNYLKVDEKSSVEVEKTTPLEVDEDYLDYISAKHNAKLKEIKPLSPLKANISLQKLAKNIGVNANKITCQNTDVCKVNFDSKLSTGDIKKYFWDFGNGQKSQKKNPSSITFEKGKYIISLKVSDEIDESETMFIVDVLGKIKKETKKLKDNTKKTLSKIEKIDMIPTAKADNIKNAENDMQKHILLSSFIFLLFLIFSFILLRKHKIL